MHRMSMPQVLDLWCELEDALCGKNGYGGSVAEIYIFCAMPHTPSYPFGTAIDSAVVVDAAREARSAMLSVFRAFEERREAEITIETVDGRLPLGTDWFANCAETYRVHVDVVSKDEA